MQRNLIHSNVLIKEDVVIINHQSRLHRRCQRTEIKESNTARWLIRIDGFDTASWNTLTKGYPWKFLCIVHG